MYCIKALIKKYSRFISGLYFISTSFRIILYHFATHNSTSALISARALILILRAAYTYFKGWLRKPTGRGLQNQPRAEGLTGSSGQRALEPAPGSGLRSQHRAAHVCEVSNCVLQPMQLQWDNKRDAPRPLRLTLSIRYPFLSKCGCGSGCVDLEVKRKKT